MLLSMFTVASDVPSNTLADARAACGASAVEASGGRLTRAVSYKEDASQLGDTNPTQICVISAPV